MGEEKTLETLIERGKECDFNTEPLGSGVLGIGVCRGGHVRVRGRGWLKGRGSASL